jgi:hypothetical protein
MQQECGAAVIATANGIKLPAAANKNKNLAMYRFIRVWSSLTTCGRQKQTDACGVDFSGPA